MHDDAFSPTPPPVSAGNVTDAPPEEISADPLTIPDVGQARLTSYHWFVLFVAILGWLFDTMDQQLFALARQPAMKQLLLPGQDVAFYGGVATCHLPHRLGAGRPRLRRPRRPHRPRPHHAADHPDLLAVHRPELPVVQLLGLRGLPLPDRPRRRRRVRRRRLAGGRGLARSASPGRAGLAAGLLGHRQHRAPPSSPSAWPTSRPRPWNGSPFSGCKSSPGASCSWWARSPPC